MSLDSRAKLSNRAKTMARVNRRTAPIVVTIAYVHRDLPVRTVSGMNKYVNRKLVETAGNVFPHPTHLTFVNVISAGKVISANNELATAKISLVKIQVSVVHCFEITIVNVCREVIRVDTVKSPREKHKSMVLFQGHWRTLRSLPFAQLHRL